MIDLLVEYAHNHNLVAEPGFAPKTVKWLLWLSETGELLDVVPLGNTDEKNNRGLQFARCPELQQPELIAGGITRSHFLVDACDVVVLYGAGDDQKKLAKHRYFIHLLEQASTAMPELAVAARALQDGNLLQQVQERLETGKAQPADKITLRVGNVTPVETDRWHDWWRRYRRSLPRKSEPSDHNMVCFATGELTKPAATHPKIGGLQGVGGRATGTALISFDKDAFRSYGLDQSVNCAISEEAAFAYRAALEHLLANHSYRLADTKVVHWFLEPIDPEDDPIEALLGTADEQREAIAQAQAQRLLRAIHSGERPELMTNRFYALTVSGSQARVMVRDWMEGSFESLVENVNRWFDNLSIVSFFGDRPEPEPSLRRLTEEAFQRVRTEQDEGKKKEDQKSLLPSPLITRMLRSAILGIPIPNEILAYCLSQIRSVVLSGLLDDYDNGEKRATDLVWRARRQMVSCVRLMKAILIRQGDTELKPVLNPDHPSPAYHCGRLLAVLASLQREALTSVDSGVVQRFYAAASSTPALILGRVVRTAQFHLDKVRSESPALAAWYERKITEILSAVGDTIPVTLNLEEQSLFALGYYQQMAYDRAGKSASKDTANSDKEVEEPI